MLIPLYGFLHGDTLGLLLLVEGHETVLDLARRLQQAASVRVAPQAQVEVWYKNQRLDPLHTIAQVGFTPLERFHVIQKGD
jgi:Toluene-4-monooxygenase system protein B (TmoB)